MNKREFLSALRARLNGEIDRAAIDEHVRYYEQYIEQEKAGGKTEEEVLMMLGDPNMIARTIIASAGSTSAQTTYQEQSEAYDDKDQGSRTCVKHMKMPSWIFWIIIAVIVFIVVSIFFKLLPLLVIGGLVLYLIRRMGR